MTNSVRYGPPGHAGDSDSHEPLDDAQWGFAPTDRLGPSSRRTRTRTLMRWTTTALFLGGAGWGAYNYRDLWSSLPPAFTQQIGAAVDRAMAQIDGGKAQAPLATRSAADDPLPLPKPAEEAKLPPPSSPVEASLTQLPTSPAPSALPPPAPPASVPGETEAVALPPPSPKLDAYQKRAAAVGLHPDLSHELLERLTPSDYQNAKVAIEKAMNDPVTDEELVWPRQIKPGLAVFHIHFVAGAARGCRRYVVAVAKGGWLTTALPMDKCARRDHAETRG